MSQPERAAAHTPREGSEEWHDLKQHLESVAILAKGFAEKFGAGEIAHLAGLWHDIGKYNPEFQRYLRHCHEAKKAGEASPRKSVPHAAYGARFARETYGPLAQVIYGHHVGLPDKAQMKNGMVEFAPNASYQTVTGEAITAIDSFKLLDDPKNLLERTPKNEFEMEFLLRMVFSALVDADFLDTEAHFEPDQTEARDTASSKKVAELWPILAKSQSALLAKAEQTNVNKVRAEAYYACLAAAELEPGIFRLAVPTGGGKTLSGLAFALKHATIKHEHHRGFDRVIVAVPYTSIIEQTVNVYRSIFDDEDVLEHHSSIRNDVRDSEAMNEARVRARLLTQNWDAPLVVTTTVQLFESLFASRTSRCRKLHNIANSVIILDEVQTLPLTLLTPTLNVLRELVEHFGVTLVLCTATQPAFESDSSYLKGFAEGSVRDIIPPSRAKGHFRQLKRVDYDIQREPCSWRDLARQISKHEQALVILNTRKDALALLKALKAEEVDETHLSHLSTLLCGAHRRKVLELVATRLNMGEPCILVSTQVVEAGVDLDFPFVYRALGPLDRIVQAAGRCNREGNIPEGGRVTIFNPEEGKVPQGEYATAVSRSSAYLNRNDLNLHEPDIFQHYFTDLYQTLQNQLDTYDIQYSRKALNYPGTAQNYRLIRDDTVPVIVKYGEAEKILEKIRYFGNVRSSDYRKLQPFTVSLRQREFDNYKNSGEIEELLPGSEVWVWRGNYDDLRGLSDVAWDITDLTRW